MAPKSGTLDTRRCSGVKPSTMGYLVRVLSGRRSWKVQYRTRVGGRSQYKDIKETDHFRLGLHTNMPIVEVKAVVRSLNAAEHLKRVEESRIKINEKITEEDLKLNANFPAALLEEFERERIGHTDKRISYWRTAKQLILEINTPMEDWEFYKTRWYRLFQSKGYSMDYIQKLLYAVNLWGRFVSYKCRVFYAPIPGPKGVEKQRLVDQYDSRGTTKEGEALTLPLLEKLKSNLKLAHYNWMFISLWLGLRPGEIDRLLQPSGNRTWRLEGNILWVFQTKLVGVPVNDRWKPIPIKYLEQFQCISIISSKDFKRPLVKTLIQYSGKHLTTYSGRKGYTDLMLERGVSLEAISQHLGHRTIDRTWKSYKAKKKVLLD